MAQTSGMMPQLSDNVKKAGEKPNRFTNAMHGNVSTPVKHKPNMAARRAAARKKAGRG
jgi:hypothetical protein